ncbi:MAG: CHRD domain-containing protein [Actinobacteria bacterium]|nr:CHRD domain-containing protein [Actinomycetota bacterium]
MRKSLTVVSGGVAVAAILALGVAVAGLASTSSSSGIGQSTSETTTTEGPKTTKHRAALTAAAEVPRPKGVKAGAGGTFKVDLTDSSGSYSIAWTLTYKNLTGRAAAAHIHRGKPGKAGPVVVSLCAPCRSGGKGKAKVSKTVANLMKGGSAYVNVHTAKNAAGEIRGQIKKAS